MNRPTDSFRQRLECPRRLSTVHAPSDFSDDNPLPSFEDSLPPTIPDMAAQLDKPIDEIREIALHHGGITLAAAQQIALWHAAAVSREARSLQADVLRRFVEFMTATKSNPIRSWALAFAADLTFVRPTTMKKIAQRLGITTSALTQQKNAMEKLLGLPRRERRGRRWVKRQE